MRYWCSNEHNAKFATRTGLDHFHTGFEFEEGGDEGNVGHVEDLGSVGEGEGP